MQYMKRTVPYILAIVLMAIVAVLFFAPDDLQGHVLQQHDIPTGTKRLNARQWMPSFSSLTG